ncbi:bifunctional 23S rRNA (guanine(2069)-N(7))-methyltransferase RlmK/23S rRNA (guanine(2445)-N(2))-methyltransferase RlmL [Buchnera aphidicola]|uniref:bifunctional 23S rRNA (guanine(2069)-N(7))-methyltransferase RlmK/23S rRNA (guanine(2445)-N(2))-methyltransferase RlmL n=1 Tax=Buchnera aphidicola TaxID=9 RepID=UPI003463A6E2
MNYLFASTFFGCEKLLEKELFLLGAKNLKIITGGIYYEGTDVTLYNSLLWSRIATKVFLCIKKFTIKNNNDLYIHIRKINWTKILNSEKNFSVVCKNINNNTQKNLLMSLKIKNIIFNQFYQKYYTCPKVNLINPDLLVVLFSVENMIHIMLDLSGDALYKRGYRLFSKNTTIQENLSAAIILTSGWKKNIPLIDPMCGSGTLVIEAAMISSDKAPGLDRKKWGFQSWKGYRKNIWEKVLKEAQERFKIGIKNCFKNYHIGYDYDSNIIQIAQKNAIKANLETIINFSTCNLNNLKNPYNEKNHGIIISHPPCESKNNTESNLISLYVQLGFISKKYFKNWKLAILSSSKFLLSFLQMQSYEKIFFKNSSLEYILKKYKIFSNICNDRDFIEDYKNRLKKNIIELKKWTDYKEIECFRIYDADLPNYKIIIDVYKEWIVIQEYQAPKIINYKKAHKRLCNAIFYSKEILSISINNIVIKVRKKQKNNQQYQKLFEKNTFFIVKEYHTKLLVNLVDYLDTGLFLENRLVRKLLGEMSKGKDFLNLFAYTGTASVYAGLGNAKSTTTIDISKTYIKWSIRNMSINNLIGNKHYFIQKDCLKWIISTNKKFDLIFFNPPNFSNSKRMDKCFELKRDYINILINLKKILRKNGNIIFSSSVNNFEINYNDIKNINLHAKKITNLVKSKDFSKKNYHSWNVTHIL